MESKNNPNNELSTRCIARMQQDAARPRPSTPKPLSLVSADPPVSLGSHTIAELWDLLNALRRTLPPELSELELVRNALIERHLPVVRFIAEKLMRSLPRHIELDTLVSAGVFGLMDAIRGFDPERNVSFKTYASMRVRGAILDMLRTEDWVPRLVRTKAGQIDRALMRLSGEFGREPTQAELADELKLDAAGLAKQMHEAKAQRWVGYTAQNDGEESEVGVEYSHADPKALRPDEIVHARQAFSSSLSFLSGRERFILAQYYEGDHTMSEIGEMLGVTESRICQIHGNVLARLRGQSRGGRMEADARGRTPPVASSRRGI